LLEIDNIKIVVATKNKALGYKSALRKFLMNEIGKEKFRRYNEQPDSLIINLISVFY
jgi:hypothetical protein